MSLRSLGVGPLVTMGYGYGVSAIVTTGYVGGTTPPPIPPGEGTSALSGLVKIQPQQGILYLNNDNLIELVRLSDELTGLPVTATVVMSLVDPLEYAVVGPQPMTLQSDGSYTGVIPNTAELIDGQSYTLVIVAVADVATAEWDIPVLAQWRAYPS